MLALPDNAHCSPIRITFITKKHNHSMMDMSVVSSCNELKDRRLARRWRRRRFLPRPFGRCCLHFVNFRLLFEAYVLLKSGRVWLWSASGITLSFDLIFSLERRRRRIWWSSRLRRIVVRWYSLIGRCIKPCCIAVSWTCSRTSCCWWWCFKSRRVIVSRTCSRTGCG